MVPSLIHPPTSGGIVASRMVGVLMASDKIRGLHNEHPPQASAFTLKNITVIFGQKTVVKDISYTFKPGSLTSIVGPNGGGKSTLLKSMMGFVRPKSGRIVCNKKDRIAYLPQRNEIDRTFPITVLDAVSMGLWSKLGIFKGATLQRAQQVANALEAVGLAHKAYESLGDLSGGQMQRVLFARLILQNTSIIMLDEPFAGIDERTTEDLMKLILRWHQEGRTVVSVLHDFDIVKKYFPDTLLMARTCQSAGKTQDVMTDKNITAVQRLALD